MKQQLHAETAQDLPEQFSIVGQGAQYIVAMLTGPEESYQDLNSHEEWAPRVLKVPLPREYVELAVTKMNVAQDRRKAKVDALISARKLHAVLTMTMAYGDEELYAMIGRPHMVSMTEAVFTASQEDLFAVRDEGRLSDACILHTPIYTQDFSAPVNRLIRAESEGASCLRLRELIDGYALTQRKLIRRGRFDDIFKLDNYGDGGDVIIVQDFSELATEKTNLIKAIESQKWEQIVDNIEFTQLSPNMQDYFNDRMAAVLQPKIIDEWATHTPNRFFLPPITDTVMSSTARRVMQSLEYAPTIPEKLL